MSSTMPTVRGLSRPAIALATLLCATLLPAPAAATATSRGPGAAPSEGTLTVDVQGLRSPRGSVLVAVYASSRGFPGTPERAVRTRIAEVEGASVLVRFPGLPAGRYAVAVVHDENRNGKLDKSFIGVPREGFGTSNDVRPTIGAPSFKDAVFAFRGDRAVAIHLIYY